MRLSLAQRFGAVVLAVVVLAAVWSQLAGFDPVLGVAPQAANLGPSLAHPLGTDHLGREVITRLAAACGAFVFPGLLAVTLCGALAVPLGALAGWAGGSVERFVRAMLGTVASIPPLVLALLLCSAWGNSHTHLALAAAIAYMPTFAEAVFARIATLRQAEFLVAARAYGLSEWRIVWRHLIVAACGPTIARQGLLLFSEYLVLETTLSYLGGFGVQEPMPSWGNMITFEWGRGNLAPLAAPVIALWLTLLALAWLAHGAAEERSHV